MIAQVAINLLKRTAAEAQDKLNAGYPDEAIEQLRTAAQTVLDELESPVGDTAESATESQPASDD